MSAILFLAGWALRSSILILSGAMLLRALRVKDPSIRLAAWTVVLGGSLAIPALSVALPSVPFAMPRMAAAPMVPARFEPVEAPSGAIYQASTEQIQNVGIPERSTVVSTRVDWARALIAMYLLVTGALLLRLLAGLAMSFRLLRSSHATGGETGGIEIRESGRVAAPVTLGIVRPAIVLPIDWREWEGIKLEAVLAHERSHVRRRDPAVQLLSVIHRSLLWHSPLSWFLHRRIVRIAEEASDDAAVAETQDRGSYAEALLDFMQRGVLTSGSEGVPMARYGDPDRRIRRILEGTLLSRGITRSGLAAIVVLGSPLAYVAATAQPQNAAQFQFPIPRSPLAPVPQAFQVSRSAVSEPTFNAVDIRSSAPNTIPEMRSAYSRGRYEIHNATMVDLIRTAWGTDADNVVGGAEWLDKDRFDVIATAPATSTPEMRRTMLQGLLKDRFQLSVHSGSKDLPAYAITARKKLQLKEADGSGGSGCVQQNTPMAPRGAPQPPITFVCQNMTMAAFAAALPGISPASGYLLNRPVLDRTGLKGAWNFSLTWSPRNVFLAAPPAADAISMFDAFDKQLGLKLNLIKAPTPVVVVDKVSRPRISEPPHARLEFEVADIRPDDPNNPRGLPCSNIGIQPGGRVRINMTLRGLIEETEGKPTQVAMGPNYSGPKSLEGSCWVILAKAPVQEDARVGWNGPVWNGVDIDTMRAMLRSLLEDRFKFAAHTEDRPVSGYALVTAKPKLLKADPSNRPGCKEGPGADGKDPRIANPLASRLVTCRNMTLAQFAAEMNGSNFGPGGPVVDATGIEGRYDITINFSPPSAFMNAGSAKAAGDAAASDPNGAISMAEALSKQLGLKLQSREVPAPALVIDRVNENPTDN